MSKNLNEAVALLDDLLTLGRTTTSVVDQSRLDAAVNTLGPIALDDVERWATRLALEIQDSADRATADAATAAQAVIEEAERADRESEQEILAQAEREERQRAGIS